MNISDISTLFPHDMLTAAALLLGGGIIAVTLYTYVYDYTARYKRNYERPSTSGNVHRLTRGFRWCPAQ